MICEVHSVKQRNANTCNLVLIARRCGASATTKTQSSQPQLSYHAINLPGECLLSHQILSVLQLPLISANRHSPVFKSTRSFPQDAQIEYRRACSDHARALESLCLSTPLSTNLPFIRSAPSSALTTRFANYLHAACLQQPYPLHLSFQFPPVGVFFQFHPSEFVRINGVVHVANSCRQPIIEMRGVRRHIPAPPIPVPVGLSTSW